MEVRPQVAEDLPDLPVQVIEPPGEPRQLYAGRRVTRLPPRDRPVADDLDPRPDLFRGGLRQWRAAAGAAQVRVNHRVRLAGPVVPGPDEPVQLLAQGGERLAGDGNRG